MKDAAKAADFYSVQSVPVPGVKTRVVIMKK
jgi:hypothetical protein